MDDHTKQGVFSWNELLTTDISGAKAFYASVFGWGTEDMNAPGGGGDYTLFKVGDEQEAGLMNLPQEARDMGAQPYWNSYISVDDIEATAKKVTELGGRVLVPPMDITGVGRFATFMDPQGAVISALQAAR